MKVREILEGCSEWIPAENHGCTNPVVSVLLPTFRRAKSGLFETAVQSVINQDFQNWELIIIDDASTDGTTDLIRHFMRIDQRISCIRHRYNVGLPAISEFEGYEKARGEYIAFLFDDNQWERDYLSRTVNYMVRNHAKAAYGCVHSYYAEGQFYELGKSGNNIGLHSLPHLNFIANGGVILAREVVEEVGLYDPHIALTRLCDWNYWKRIVKKYEFHETGILAGTEMGALQKDSLGNSYPMNGWVAAEREALVQDDMFLSRNYLDIEINMVCEKNTWLYREWVESVYQGYEKKQWYKQGKMLEFIEERARLRVLFLANEYNASFELAFSHMMGKGAFVFRCGGLEMPIHEVVQADVVILIRDMIPFANHKQMCEKLKIPCYLYIDDNFIELAKENKRDRDLQLLRETYKWSFMNNLSGVFTSTENLKTYFYENALHRNLYCIEPCIGGKICSASNRMDERKVTLAYMGGPWRDRVFVHTVMPALSRLSERLRVLVVVPDRISLDDYKDVENLEVVQVPYSLSLELTLMRYAKYQPAILIHCGPKIKNNQYKTKNALINAVRIGAVLVASDESPYNEDDQSGISWFCVGNATREWYELLQEAALDEKRRQKILENALSYCQTRYRAEKATHILQEAFRDIRPASHYEIIRRLNEVMFDTLYVGTMRQNLISLGGDPQNSRSLTEVPLSFTGGIAKMKNYQIRCTVDSFSELGICFSSYGEAYGHVRVKIICREGQLRECVLDLEEYVHDNWTYLAFDPIENAKGQLYQITLEFEYDTNSALVGVFEDATKRSFLYRLSNKLGHPIKVTNLLFADCR